MDLDLVAAVQYAPRAPLNTLAAALATSPSTAGRRLNRLQSEGLVRFVGQIDWSLFSNTHPRHVWISTEPGQSHPVAERMAERAEAQFVAVTTGQSGVYCVVHPGDDGRARQLLTEELPCLPGVAALSSDLVLRPVARADSWRLARLEPDQLGLLDAHRPPRGPVQSYALGPQERSAVRLLHADARISSRALGRTLGVSQSTAHRLIQGLFDSQAVRPRVEVEPTLLGFRVEAILALAVPPASLNHAIETLGAHPSGRYVSQVAGSVSLIHHGVFRDEGELARFLSEDLAAIEGLSDVRVAVVLDVLQRYWVRRNGSYLGQPRVLLPDVRSQE